MIVTDGLLMKITLPSGNDLTNKWATFAGLETIHYQHPGHINRESTVYIFVVGQKFRRATLLAKKSRECNDLFGILDHFHQSIGPILVNFVPTLEPIFHLGIFFCQNSKFKVKYFLTCSAM